MAIVISQQPIDSNNAFSITVSGFTGTVTYEWHVNNKVFVVNSNTSGIDIINLENKNVGELSEVLCIVKDDEETTGISSNIVNYKFNRFYQLSNKLSVSSTNPEFFVLSNSIGATNVNCEHYLLSNSITSGSRIFDNNSSFPIIMPELEFKKIKYKRKGMLHIRYKIRNKINT